jgi:hypothetical protein
MAAIPFDSTDFIIDNGESLVEAGSAENAGCKGNGGQET